METLYKNLGMIIGFLSGAFLLQVFFGEKFAEKSVLLILFTMILIPENSKEFKKFLNKINDKLSEEQKRKINEQKKKKITSKKNNSTSGGGLGGGGSSSW